MQCPKCAADFEEVAFSGVAVQRCIGCRGIWFDRSKHEYLKDVEGSESIDIGDPKIGKLQNDSDDLTCPECASPMIRMVDSTQPHIWYESCSTCFGVYFDAGEFSDYKDKTILDFVRDLFAQERR